MMHKPTPKRGLTLLLGVVVASSTGCTDLLNAGMNPDDPDGMRARNAPGYAAMRSRPESAADAPLDDITTDTQALAAFFQMKRLIAQVGRLRNPCGSRHTAAEAARLAGLAASYYEPDVRALAAGTRPPHATANWRFLKELHHLWHKSRQLSGNVLSTGSQQNRDAWTLGIWMEFSRAMKADDVRFFTGERLLRLQEVLGEVIQQEEACLNREFPCPRNPHYQAITVRAPWPQTSSDARTLVANVLKAASRRESLLLACWNSRSAPLTQDRARSGPFYYGDPITGAAHPF